MGKYRVTAVFADTELAGWGGGWYNCSLLPSTRSSVVGFVLSNIYTFQLLEFALLIKLFWWTCSPSPLQSHQIIVSHQILCIEKKNSEFILRNDQCIFWVQSRISRYFYLNGNRKVLLLILESFITSHLWILLHLWLQDWRSWSGFRLLQEPHQHNPADNNVDVATSFGHLKDTMTSSLGDVILDNSAAVRCSRWAR